MEKVKAGIKTTEFWLALLGAIIPVLNQYLGLNLPSAAILGITGIIISYIFGRSIVKKAVQALLILLLPLCLISVKPVFAEDTTPASLIPKIDINFQGDTIYSVKNHVFMGGFGINIATVLKGAVELRGEYATDFNLDNEAKDKIGAGIGVNLPKTAELLHGNWLLPGWTPSLGIMIMLDISKTSRVELMPYITAIKIGF